MTADPGRLVGSVGLLLRFPVKSMAGESLSQAVFTSSGLDGDRAIALVTSDGGLGSGKRTRRFRRVEGLRSFTAITDGDRVLITGPDGVTMDAGDPDTSGRVSAALGQILTVQVQSDIPHHDESDVHLVASSSVDALEAVVGGSIDPRRFRPNLVIDTVEPGFLERGWTGRELAIGDDVVLRVGEPMVRCRMVDDAGADIRSGPRVLTTIGRLRDSEFGATARVHRSGTVNLGDPVVLRPHQ